MPKSPRNNSTTSLLLFHFSVRLGCCIFESINPTHLERIRSLLFFLCFDQFSKWHRFINNHKFSFDTGVIYAMYVITASILHNQTKCLVFMYGITLHFHLRDADDKEARTTLTIKGVISWVMGFDFPSYLRSDAHE